MFLFILNYMQQQIAIICLKTEPLNHRHAGTTNENVQLTPGALRPRINLPLT